MADVQTEHGFTMIANDLMDAIVQSRIPAEVRRVFDYILRNTYGYKRKSFETTHYQISQDLKTPRQRVSESLQWLRERNMVNGTEKCAVLERNHKTTLGIQKDFDRWKNGTEKCAVARKSVPSTARKSVQTSSRKKKENSVCVQNGTEKRAVYRPPTGDKLKANGHAWIDSQAWDEWIEHLKQKKCKPTELAIKKQLALLFKFKSVHKDIIEKAITSNWQGLFPLKRGMFEEEADAPRQRILEAPND
jgi:phage replication O-like protein O